MKKLAFFMFDSGGPKKSEVSNFQRAKSSYLLSLKYGPLKDQDWS